MATYIAIFIFELLTAYILWFLLKRGFKTTKFYRIAIICLIVSLVVGYVASYRIVGYQVTMGYLTAINDQRIEETSQGISLQEEDELKEDLFESEEFQTILINSSIKLSLIPFIFVIIIMVFPVVKASKNLPPNRDT